PVESSCWDKVPSGERSPQQGQHWRSWGWVVLGRPCGEGCSLFPSPQETAGPSPGLWTTPAHSHCMPQTNTRRAQTNNIFVYGRCHGYRS
ncbi:proline-rich protein 26-like, partial [Papio anubis]|uniref:proline-rich protein 26-like n=1 Tax=Papio anubis TaxID=9555 RepID=UPI0012AD86FA